MESGADEILPSREDEDVAFLVVGDPFGATTHTDLILRAKEKGIQVDGTAMFTRIIIYILRKYQNRVLYFHIYLIKNIMLLIR